MSEWLWDSYQGFRFVVRLFFWRSWRRQRRRCCFTLIIDRMFTHHLRQWQTFTFTLICFLKIAQLWFLLLNASQSKPNQTHEQCGIMGVAVFHCCLEQPLLQKIKAEMFTAWVIFCSFIHVMCTKVACYSRAADFLPLSSQITDFSGFESHSGWC